MFAVAITTPVIIAPMQENSTKSITLLTIITSIALSYRMLPAWQKRGGELSDLWSRSGVSDEQHLSSTGELP